MAEKSISIDKAWEILFDRHDIAKQVTARGSFRISSAEINTVKEARLMAKFDQSAQLPAIFKQHKLSILPVSRGEYIIGGFETHAKIKYDSVRPTPVPVPNLQTIDYTNLYSESSALLFAYNSGIIADILGGEAVFTVNGRMSSGAFSYWVRNNRLPAGEQHLDVVNAQVEIDAGYESRDALMLCEAKNAAVDELLIRQLYYPYRLWSSKISKPILPVFLVYSNDVFHAFIYRFFDREFYNSLELVEHKALHLCGRGHSSQGRYRHLEQHPARRGAACHLPPSRHLHPDCGYSLGAVRESHDARGGHSQVRFRRPADQLLHIGVRISGAAVPGHQRVWGAAVYPQPGSQKHHGAAV